MSDGTSATVYFFVAVTGDDGGDFCTAAPRRHQKATMAASGRHTRVTDCKCETFGAATSATRDIGGGGDQIWLDARVV